MTRLLGTILIILAAGGALADDPGSDKPAQARLLGTWTRQHEDGSVTNLTINEKRLHWKAEMPDRGITTMVATTYEISEEGVLFGYVRELSWKNETDNANITTINPFAFRVKVDQETLVISDLRMWGADDQAHQGLSGEYRKAIERSATKPDAERQEIKR